MRPTLLFVCGLFVLAFYQNCDRHFESIKIPSQAKLSEVGTSLPTNFKTIMQFRGPYMGTPDYAHLTIDMLSTPLAATLDVLKHTPNGTGGTLETRCNLTFRLDAVSESDLLSAIMVIRYANVKNNMTASDGENPSTRFVYRDCSELGCTAEDVRILHNYNDLSSASLDVFASGKAEFLQALKNVLERQDLSVCPDSYKSVYQDNSSATH